VSGRGRSKSDGGRVTHHCASNQTGLLRYANRDIYLLTVSGHAAVSPIAFASSRHGCTVQWPDAAPEGEGSTNMSG